MAVKQPLIRYPDTGKLEELRPGDTLPASGSTGASETFAFFMSG